MAETSRRQWLADLRFLAVAGVGLFADGYLNTTIGLVVPMLGYLYFEKTDGSVPAVSSDIMKGGLSVGMILGQILFGVLGDTFGRRKVYGKELLITMFGTLLVILVPWKGFSSSSVVAWIAVFRVVTGVGIGADYPMSSTLSAESNRKFSRAKMVLIVFSNIGAGGLVAGLIFIILLAAFKQSIELSITHLEWVWRLLLGLGLLPCAATVYARLTMKETVPYEKYVVERQSKSNHSQAFAEYFSEWKNVKNLIAVSSVWFLFDIAYYGINLNQSIILSQIGFGSGKTPWHSLFHIAIGNIIAVSAGYVPGFYVGIFLPDLVGRVRLQFWACTCVSGLYAVWAGVFTTASPAGLMALFTISQFVLNIGPNVTTFLLPVELFPTRVRGTAHGIAAASGKCGAVVTAFAFGSVADAIGVRGVLGLFSGIMALAAVITLSIPETKNTTLDEIEGQAVPESSDGQSSSEEYHVGKLGESITESPKK